MLDIVTYFCASLWKKNKKTHSQNCVDHSPKIEMLLLICEGFISGAKGSFQSELAYLAENFEAYY